MNDAQFWDKAAPKYSKSAIRDQEYYEQTLDRTRSYLHADDRVLEIGCGTGSTALLLAPSVASISATDISPGMIKIANDKAQDQGITNANFQVSGVADHGSNTKTYSAVLAHNLLHLVENLDGAVSTIAKRLEPKGLFISKTPCAPQNQGLKWFGLKIMIRVMQLFGKAPFVRFLTISKFEQKIEAHGFEIVETFHKQALIPVRYIVARKL